MSSAGCKSLCQPVAQNKPLLVHVHTSFPAVANSSKYVLQLLPCIAMHKYSLCKCKHAHSQALFFDCLYQTVSNVWQKTLPLPGTVSSRWHMAMKTRWIWEGRPTCCKPLPPQAGLGYAVSKGRQIRVQCQKFLLPEHSSDKSPAAAYCTSLKISQVRGKRPTWTRLKILLLREWGVKTSQPGCQKLDSNAQLPFSLVWTGLNVSLAEQVSLPLL